jgi:uroporphyrinogen-III synthase
MRLLVTRPPDDAAPLVEALEARGHDCLVEPLFTLVPAAVDHAALAEALGGVQALLFTSANGARAFAARSPRRDLPVYAVGDATAAAARAAGFAGVDSAGGDVQALAALVAARLDPARGALFHAAGRQVAGDLQGQLAARGFALRRLVLYEAQPVASLSPAAQAPLRDGAIDAVLFFSPRSGGSFVRLLTDAGLQGEVGRVHALCLSSAVAESVAALAWARTTVAARPETAALLEALDGLTARRVQAATAVAPGPDPRNGSTAKDQQVDDKQSDGKRPDGGDAETAGPRTSPTETGAEAPALAVIAAFGGIRPMAAKLGIAVSTVQGWRERAAIPQPRHEEIMAAARSHGVALDPAALAAADHPPVAAPAPRSPLPQSGGAQPPSDKASDKPGDQAGAAVRSTETQAAPSRAPETKRPAAAQVQAERAQAARRGGAGWAFFLLGALVFGAGAAAAVVTRPQWQPLLAGLTGEPAGGEGAVAAPELDQRLAALEADIGDLDAALARIAAQPANGAGAKVDALSERLDALEKRLDALEKETQAAIAAAAGASAAGASAAGAAAGGVTAEDLTPLRDAVEQLTERVAAVEGRAPGDAADAEALASLSGELTSLAARLTTAEDAGRGLQATVEQLAEAREAAQASAGGSAALALAVAQLRDALRGGAPYSAELQQLRGLSHDDPELAALLDPLAPHAESGAPTLEALQRSFPQVARGAIAAAQGDEADGWLGGVLRRVSGVITVRPVGEVEGDSAGAVIARAESRLQVGDLAAAASELDGLQGRAAEEMRAWRDQAQARVVAERALSQLAAHAIAKLGPEDG